MTEYMRGFQPAVSSFWDQSIVYSLRLQGFYAIRSAKAERKSKEYRQKLENINKDQVWQDSKIIRRFS